MRGAGVVLLFGGTIDVVGQLFLLRRQLGVGGRIGRLGGVAQLHLVDIGFGDLGAHGHGVGAGQLHDRRGGIVVEDGLTLFGDHLGHHPVHRGPDVGLVEVALALLQDQLLVGDFLALAVDLGLGAHRTRRRLVELQL